MDPCIGRADRADAETLRRLRWRARRGLLENDLLIGRFLDQQGDALKPADADALARLLDLPRPNCSTCCSGTGKPAGALDSQPVRDVLLRLQAVRLEPPRTPCTPPRNPGA